MIKATRARSVVLSAMLVSLLSCGGTEKTSNDAKTVDAQSWSQPDRGVSDALFLAGDEAIKTDASTIFTSTSLRPLSTLSDVEAQSLCDEVAANQGGYGHMVYCDGGVQTTDTSQRTCAAGMPGVGKMCPNLTAGDLVACSLATGADLCKYSGASECSAVRACLG